jgi:paraquat-inducible protein B
MKQQFVTVVIGIISLSLLIAGAALTYAWHIERGPEITIHLNKASGLVPKQAKIMYKGVQVGTVSNITLGIKSKDVIVKARISKQLAELLGADSKFWLVTPKLGFDKISNLGTIATGNYIEVEPVNGAFSADFNGLDNPPIDVIVESGRRLILITSTLDGITTDTPILYRGFKIGEIRSMKLATDSKTVNMIAYVYKEYVDVIRKNSHFANISGFHAGVSLFGSSHIDMASAATLVKGGIEVTTPNKSAPIAKNNDVFRVLTSKQEREPPPNVNFESGRQLTLITSTLDGITTETPILYRGFQVGEISSVNLAKDRNSVVMVAYIYKEYVDVVRRNSHFANISGFHAGLSLFGTSHLDMGSAQTLVKGGIEVTTPNKSAMEAKNGDVFQVLTTKEEREAKK